MSAALENILAELARHGHAPLFKGILHGIEKEGLRVAADGQLAQSMHPQALGSALSHAYITTDYSEALLEFITPVFRDSRESLDFLADLHRFALPRLPEGEELWCASMPNAITSDEQIRIAEYGSSNAGQLKHIYRVGLEHRYGKLMQTIAGIHYNFSLPEGLWPVLQEMQAKAQPELAQMSLQAFRSHSYFSLIRNFRRWGWLLIYLFGASPALSASFLAGRAHQLQPLTRDTLHLPYATSLRMSDLGYSNKAQAGLQICFNHLDSYTDSLHKAIHTPYAPYADIGIKVDGRYRQLNSNVLQIENEYYSDIRPKRVTHPGEKPLQALQARGVEYIEVRNTDINPFLPTGISAQQADFMDAFLVTCLLADSPQIDDAECSRISENLQRVVNRGREPGLELLEGEHSRTLKDWGHALIGQISKTAALLDNAYQGERFSTAVQAQTAKLDEPGLTPSAQVLEAMIVEDLSYCELVQSLSAEHRRQLLGKAINNELESKLLAEVESSLQRQADTEAGDTQDFDSFLADYLNS